MHCSGMCSEEGRFSSHILTTGLRPQANEHSRFTAKGEFTNKQSSTHFTIDVININSVGLRNVLTALKYNIMVVTKCVIVNK